MPPGKNLAKRKTNELEGGRIKSGWNREIENNNDDEDGEEVMEKGRVLSISRSRDGGRKSN